MELLTGLAVGWQQRLHSVKVPQTKGGAPRLHRIPVKPSLWRLPERKNEVQCQGPSFCIWLSLSASAMAPLPQDKDKDREMPHMLGRGGRWGPIRDRK